MNDSVHGVYGAPRPFAWLFKANQTSGYSDAGSGALSGYSIIRCAAGNVNTDCGSINAVHEPAALPNPRVRAPLYPNLTFVDPSTWKE